MIISRTEINSAISASRPTRKRQPAGSSSATEATVSADGLSFSLFAAEVAQAPFFREELVNELGRRISEGKYFVPSDQIVDKILGRLFAEAALA